MLPTELNQFHKSLHGRCITNISYFVVDLDATTLYNDKCSEVLDFGSESDSDIEPSTLSSVWNDAHADSSGDESIDSEHEDPLK